MQEIGKTDDIRLLGEGYLMIFIEHAATKIKITKKKLRFHEKIIPLKIPQKRLSCSIQ